MKYIIISLKHGTGKQPMFWRANSAGYCYSPFAAGHYDEETIKANPGYYNNGKDSIAIPLTDFAMDTLGFKCSYLERSLVNFKTK